MAKLHLVVNDTYYALFWISDGIAQRDYIFDTPNALLTALGEYKNVPIEIVINSGSTKIANSQLPPLKLLDRIGYLRNLRKTQNANVYGYHLRGDCLIEVSIPTLQSQTLNAIPNPISGIYSIPITSHKDDCLVVTKHGEFYRHSCYINYQIAFTRYLKKGISSVDETMKYIKHKYQKDVALTPKERSDLFMASESSNAVCLEITDLQKLANEPTVSKAIKISSAAVYGIMFVCLGITASGYYQHLQSLKELNYQLVMTSSQYHVMAKGIPSLKTMIMDAKLYQDLGKPGDPVSDLQTICTGMEKIYHLDWNQHNVKIHAMTKDGKSHCDRLCKMGYAAKVLDGDKTQGELAKKGQLMKTKTKETRSVIKIEKPE